MIAGRSLLLIKIYEVNFTGKIFFYCYPSLGPPEKEPYQHLLVCLRRAQATGDRVLLRYNYWQESTEKNNISFVIIQKITPDDSIVILQHIWFSYGRLFPENLFHPNRKYVTVYLDSQERNKPYSFNSEFRQFDFIFRTHYNSKFKYPSNFHPWFWLSNRILQELEGLPNFQDKKDT